MKSFGPAAVAAVAVCSILGARTAHAQAPVEGTIGKGTSSLSLAGSLNFTDGTSGNVAGSYSYFISDKLEVGPQFDLFFEKSGSFSSTSGDISGFARYNFGALGTGAVPYVSAALGAFLSTGGGNSTEFDYGGAAGVSYFTKPTQSFFVEYSVRGESSSSGGSGSSSTQQSINFGLRVFFDNKK